MSLNEYFGDWVKVIDLDELSNILSILKRLYGEKELTPAFADVFKAFTLCSLKDCKVVFLGQDPYPQRNVATGILFANRKETTNISPSLKVIEKSVLSLYGNSLSLQPFDITMESWASQGILMLNSALTCEVGKIGSHTALWRPFMSRLFMNMGSYNGSIPYALFGNQAQSFEPYITGSVIHAKHPAYYARTGNPMPNDVFVKVNCLIKGEPVRWLKNT